MLNLTMGGLSGGYKKYLQQLVPLLNSHKDVSDILQIVPPKYQNLPGLGSNVHPFADGEQWRGFPYLQQRVRDWKPDVIFVPTARYLDLGSPIVSMVRNMEPMLPGTLQNGLTAWFKNKLGASLAKRAAHKSTRVIAVSEHVRDYLVNNWAIDSRKIGVVYHGVDAPQAGTVPSAKVQSLGGTDFVFAAGSLVPYRGLEDAIRALAHVGGSLKLAIAGDGWDSYRQQMQSLAESLGVSDRTVWLGHLGETEMAWAYTNSRAFLMTSRVEACPNTALEAMAGGAVCISTKEPPMPEFFRDAALYYEAGEGEQLAQQIRAAVAMEEQERQRIASAAKARAGGFSWQGTAEKTVEQLRLAVG